MPAIALDMDGTVSNFIGSYTSLAHMINHEVPIITDYQQAKSWDFSTWVPNYTKEINEEVWTHILNSRNFWVSEEALFPNDMSFLASKHRDPQFPIIFLTRRDGVLPWEQTIRWLHRYDIHEPLVVRVQKGEEKGDWCRRLGIKVLIDDAPMNAERLGDGVKLIMPDWPYNKHVNNVIRVPDLGNAIIAARVICSGEAAYAK